MYNYSAKLKQISGKLFNTLVVFMLLIERSNAIQCFSCGSNNVLLEFAVSCSKFDGSRDFIEECPFSTMCLRTTHKLVLAHGLEWTTTILGCAPQKFPHHVIRNRLWEEVVSIKEPYPEDCVETQKSFKIVKTTHCYCRGHLCNSAEKNVLSKIWILLPLMIIQRMFRYMF